MTNEQAPTREELTMPKVYAFIEKTNKEYTKLVEEGKGTSPEAIYLRRLICALYDSMQFPLQVVSCSGTSWLDWLVRIFTGFKRTSHMAYIRGEVKVEAWAGENKVRVVVGIKKGYEKNKVFIYDCAEYISKEDQDKIWNWAIGEEGSHYDWLAALGIAIKKNLDTVHAYICSELTYQGFLNLNIIDANSGITQASKVSPSIQENASYLIFNREV